MTATATVTLTATGTGVVTIDDVAHPVTGTSLASAREKVRAYVASRAERAGTEVTMTATEPDGTWTVVVHPDGTVTAPPPVPSEDPRPEAAPPPATTPAPPGHRPAPPEHGPSRTGRLPTSVPPARPAASPPPRPAPGAALDQQPVASPSHQPRPHQHGRPGPTATTSASPEPAADSPAVPGPGPTSAQLRQQARSRSMLTDVTNEAPAREGLRGALNTLGMHLAPSTAERARRADEAAVSQHWPGPRTIAVVNGKGGAGKTPAVVLLSAVLARHGGAGVVAWDNNSTRGTLGWRTQAGPHQATLGDLLPHAERLLSPAAQAAEMAAFVHHQREDRYDVLRSRPEVLADAQPTDAASVRAVHRVLTKYYRVIVVDSGNDESTGSWRAMIERADAVVVPTITRPEHAESARLLLDELAGADAHSARLAEQAVVIVSQASRAEPAPDQLVTAFQEITRAAVGVPYDPAMAGRPLILDSLAPATRRAWLAAAAAVADGLAATP